MKRLPDWRTRLTAYLASVARSPFRPGRHDCALFAAGAVEAQTGVDLARGWRGYRTLSEGQSRLAEGGYDSHVALLASALPEVPPSFARPGDVAVLQGDLDKSIGVVQGARVYVVGHGGLGVVLLRQAERAFRV